MNLAIDLSKLADNPLNLADPCADQPGHIYPLALYRAAGVPVVLSTDDEGVSRSDMTPEYLRAATEQGLRYTGLKAMARASLWQGGRVGVPVAACRPLPVEEAAPTGTCGAFVADSEKAAAQWRLEGEYRAFEESIGRLPF